MQKYYARLAGLLKSNSEFVIDEKLNKNMLAELARKYDAGLLNGADPLHELIKGGSLMCTGGSQKCIDGSHGVKYSKDTRIIGMPFYNEEKRAEFITKLEDIQ